MSEPGSLPLVCSRALPAGCCSRKTGGTAHSDRSYTHDQRLQAPLGERNCRIRDEEFFPDLVVIAPASCGSRLPDSGCRGTKMQPQRVYM